MYIIIDDRDIVAGGYAIGFDREGVSSAGIEAGEFREWIGKISDTDMGAVLTDPLIFRRPRKFVRARYFA
jgi:hypothetical protein